MQNCLILSPSPIRRFKFLCIMTIGMAGFRDMASLPDWNDTPVYQNMFERIKITSWSELFQDFHIISTEYSERDTGFPLLVKTFQIFSNDFTLFLLFVAAVFIIPMGKLIYSYAKSSLGIVESFLLYFIFFDFLTTSALRQCIAMGLTMWSINYVTNNNWKKFIILILIAFTIHSSVFIAVPMYFLRYFKFDRKKIFLVLALVPVLVSYSTILLQSMFSGGVYDGYANMDEIGKPINYMAFIILILVAYFVFYKQIVVNKNSEILLGGMLCAAMLLPLAWIGGPPLRITYYYSIFMLPVLPLIIDSMNVSKPIRTCVHIGVIIVMTFFALKV